jgi:hypothetical protein
MRRVEKADYFTRRVGWGNGNSLPLARGLPEPAGGLTGQDGAAAFPVEVLAAQENTKDQPEPTMEPA